MKNKQEYPRRRFKEKDILTNEQKIFVKTVTKLIEDQSIRINNLKNQNDSFLSITNDLLTRIYLLENKQ